MVEIDPDEPYRHQKKSRKKKFFIQRRCVKNKPKGFLHDMYVRFGWYEWHRHKSYETEKAREQAMENLLSASRGNRWPGEWEYRKEE